MRIPEVRKRLHELADIHGLDELHELASELHRRKRVERQKAKANHMTEELKGQIIDYYRAHPNMLFREIGDHFGVDGGRVSEAISGKRK